MKPAAKQLAAVIKATPEGQLLLGNVVSIQVNGSISDASLTVDVRGGQISGVRYLSHVAPRPGYAVVLQRFGKDLVAVGTLAQHGWPACRVRKAADGTAFASGTQNLTFDTAVADPWAMWNGGQEVATPLPGLYDVCGSVQYDGDSTGTYREVAVLLDGSYIAQQRVPPPPSGTTGSAVTATGLNIPCTAGQIFKLAATHNSSTSRYAVGGRSDRSVLSVTYRGPL